MSPKKYVSILHQANNIILLSIIKGCFQLPMTSRILDLQVHVYSCTHACVVLPANTRVKLQVNNISYLYLKIEIRVTSNRDRHQSNRRKGMKGG